MTDHCPLMTDHCPLITDHCLSSFRRASNSGMQRGGPLLVGGWAASARQGAFRLNCQIRHCYQRRTCSAQTSFNLSISWYFGSAIQAGKNPV